MNHAPGNENRFDVSGLTQSAPQQGNCIGSVAEKTGSVKQKTKKKNPYTGHQRLQGKAHQSQKEPINKKGLPQKAFCGGIKDYANALGLLRL